MRSYLPLVARRVAWFLRFQGVDSAHAETLFNAGKIGVEQLLARHGVYSNYPEYDPNYGEELFSAGVECLLTLDTTTATFPEAYIAKAIDRALLRAKRDRILAIPQSTRRDRINRGEEPGDLERHSWGDVFDDDNALHRHYRKSHWQDSESQWFDREHTDPEADWLEVINTYEALYWCCCDDADRRIIDARMGGGLTPAILDDGFLAIHVADVAKMVGLSPRTVQRRLDRLQARYSKLTNFRFTKRKQQQQPACGLATRSPAARESA